MPLSPLREELALHPGPNLIDGQPSWTLQDPVRNQFFRIDWPTFEILSRWHLDDTQAIADAVTADTTLHLDIEDVEAVLEFAIGNELVQPQGADAARKMAERQRTLRGTLGSWLLHNYLFFRIPLVKPDRWLGRCSSLVAPLFSRTFLRITLLALAVGLVQVYRDCDRFSATLVDTFSWSGLITYGCALFVVKVLHELGHAFTAKRYGCRVPAMGVAFLVLWPVAYTDTNEVWKLASKRERLAVAVAGATTELVIAVWATLLWGFLPEGGIKSVAFVLATLTWVTTLAINASPFMRFDGYFVLSDWLEMPNLHNRAFALARWDLRERLFALGEPPPEYFSRRRTLALVAFSWAVWIYRLIVFIGIAVLVYHFFIKAAGILLFAIEVGWFILLPLWRELKVWGALWPRLKHSPRARRNAALAACILLLFTIPLPTRLAASAYLKPAESYPIYAPAGAQIATLPWADGSQVPAGAPMLRLTAPEMEIRVRRARAHLDLVRQQVLSATLNEQQRQNLTVLQQEQTGAEAELAGIESELQRYAPIAPFAGRLRDLNPELSPGTWGSNRERLALLVKSGKWQVETYLDEEAMRHVKIGDAARFFADGLGGTVLPLTVVAIDRDATRALQNGMLASQFGGSVLVRERHNQLIPELAVYRVTLEAEHDPGSLAGHSWRGCVVIRGNWEAPGMSFVRAALALLSREAGF